MTEDDVFDPVIARLQCGELLQTLRGKLDQGKIEKEMLAEVPKYYATKLNKIEAGTIAPGPADVEWLVKRYRPKPSDADELLRLAELARRRAKPVRTGKAAQQYVSLERRAREIRMVYNEIPGLCQPEEFALQALSVSPVVAASAVAGMAAERAERGRTIIRPDGASVWLVLGEDALYRWSGSPAVLRRALEHIRDIAAMPNVKLRILLRSAGIVPALSCPFTLLHVDGDKTLAMVATLSRPDYIKATAPYVAAFEQAWELASSDRDSKAILEARITDLIDS
ncbi:DUF5753 domain-containing protein [Lentzea sp. NPDC059081]|uniref:DUF5753 domain-containing protein n=1 Tax=Lentzea sp. NPDC059081 TaxID=3346719 RepID=UPI0036B9C771